MKRTYKITCAVCGTKVTKNNPQITCGRKCRDILRKQNLIAQSEIGECVGCGEITPLVYKAAGVMVCSHRCQARIRGRQYWALHHGEWHQSDHANLSPLPKERQCANCGKTFKPPRHDSKCCSDICYGRWNWKHGKGEKVIGKLAAQREVLNIEVGQCSICLTDHTQILSQFEMGGRSKGKAKFHSDHIIPKANGGTDAESNRRWVCWFCNNARLNLSTKYDAAIAAAGKAFWKAIHISV